MTAPSQPATGISRKLATPDRIGTSEPARTSEPGERPTDDPAWTLRRTVNRGRLALLAGLALLFVAGFVEREQPVVFAATLLLAGAFATAQEWVLRDRPPAWLPVATGATDGLTAAALVYSSGGPASTLDVLYPAAIVALATLPTRIALSLAIFDVWLSALAIAVHPSFIPALHARSLVSQLAIFVLIAASACAAARVGAQARRERELAHWRSLRDQEEAEHVRRSALGRANLIAMLSHDLRTPLTSIKGFAQLLLRDQAAPEQTQRYVRVVLSETNRAIRTISDAADLAWLQCSQGELRLEPIDLQPILEAAVAALEHHDPERRVRLAVQTPLPTVRGDPSRVERIMVNLISSTLRYSPGNSPIVVGAAGDAAGVLVWVQDQGRGVPPEKFAHIFDLETEDTKGECEFHGSGLGLYISKQLVEAHGGHLWVESAEGHGSRFVFRLQP